MSRYRLRINHRKLQELDKANILKFVNSTDWTLKDKWSRFRYWLIRKIAGDMGIVYNVKLRSITFSSKNLRHTTFMSHCVVDGEQVVWFRLFDQDGRDTGKECSSEGVVRWRGARNGIGLIGGGS